MRICKKFVEAGGTLVFLNRASNFAIEQFNLPVKDVTQGLTRKDFYIPGSILRTELDTTHPIAKGMPQQSIAWFENSPAFEIQTDPLALTKNFTDHRHAIRKTRSRSSSPAGPSVPKRSPAKPRWSNSPSAKARSSSSASARSTAARSLATFPLLFNVDKRINHELARITRIFS